MKLSETTQRPIVALSLLALGMAVIPLNDALIKLLSGAMPLSQIITIRAVMSLILISVFSDGLRRMLKLSAKVFWLFVGRSMCLVTAMFLFFVPLGSLPLPTAVSIFFVSPLLITLLSVPFLGEKIGIHRIGSVIAGMVGVVLIIRPGSADFQPETLMVVGSALSYALFQIWTRRLKSLGDLRAMVAVQHVCYFAAACPFLLLNWMMPAEMSGNASVDFLLRGPIMPDMTQYGIIAVCAFAVLFLSMVSSNAYRAVEASLIAPFEYAAIPFGVFWGIMIWGDWPEPTAWAGMTLILCGGLYAVYREKERDADVITQSPMPASAAIAQNDVEEDK
ncbi:DMT family transporter [Alphaproteobacteria bacterium]|nr:DMT family transporter [Alphaproteobacteria bacterium]